VSRTFYIIIGLTVLFLLLDVPFLVFKKKNGGFLEAYKGFFLEKLIGRKVKLDDSCVKKHYKDADVLSIKGKITLQDIDKAIISAEQKILKKIWNVKSLRTGKEIGDLPGKDKRKLYSEAEYETFIKEFEEYIDFLLVNQYFEDNLQMAYKLHKKTVTPEYALYYLYFIDKYEKNKEILSRILEMDVYMPAILYVRAKLREKGVLEQWQKQESGDLCNLDPELSSG